MTLREEFNSLKDSFSNLNPPESKLTATITAENTGELMDLANDCNSRIIAPFSDSREQDYYYFTYPLKENIVLQVKSLPKKYRND